MIVKKIRINYIEQSINKFIDVEFNKNDYINSSVMGDNELFLNFSLPYYFEFAIETTYIEYIFNSGTARHRTRYYLYNSAQPKKNNSESFDYSLRFETEQGKLKKWIVRNLLDNRIKFSITSTPLQMLQLIVDNCNNRNTDWTVGTCIDVPQKTVSFNSTNVLDALQIVADTFETEWYISNKIISIGKEGENITRPLSLSYGRGYGVKPIIERKNTEQKPIGKLFVQGGDKNINSSTYGNKTLLLPKNQTIWYNGVDFVEAVGNFGAPRQYLVDTLGISIRRIGLLPTDREESIDLSNIYPQRVGEVSSVVVSTFQNSYYHAYWQHPSQTEPFYDIIDSSIPSSLDYWSSAIRLPGQILSITFQTGKLAGRTFDISGYIHSERKFQLVPLNEDGVNYPNPTFAPQARDKYIVFGCALPNSYIRDDATKTGASWEMLREAIKYLWEREEQQVTFTLPIDETWYRNSANQIKKGDYINFIDSDFSPNGTNIRVIGLKQYLSNPYKLELTLSNVRVDRRFRRQRNVIDVLDETLTTYNRDAISFTDRASFQNFVGGRDALRRTQLNVSSINTKNKKLNTLLDFRDNSVLGFFSYDIKETVSVEPNIIISDNILHLESPIFFLDSNRINYYMLETQDIDLEDNEVNYIYVRGGEFGFNAVLYASTELKNFEDGEEKYFLIGFVNPEIDSERTIEYTYIGDVELASPLVIDIKDINSYTIELSSANYPTVIVIDSENSVVETNIRYISKTQIQVKWVNKISGKIIIKN